MKAIRIFFRSFREAFKSVFRNFSLSIASVTCTAITLVLVSLAILVSYNVNHVTQKLENELTIVVYLEGDDPDSDYYGNELFSGTIKFDMTIAVSM